MVMDSVRRDALPMTGLADGHPFEIDREVECERTNALELVRMSEPERKKTQEAGSKRI